MNLWNSSPAAFSLVEVLFVLVIVSILAGLVLGTAKYASTKAATSRAQTEIAAIEMALENYKNDNGTYPPTTYRRASSSPGYPTTIEISNSAVLFNHLAGDSKTYGFKRYYTFRPDQIRTNTIIASKYVVDPYGNPYNYYVYLPGNLDQAMNGTSFDLWSYGPNGTNNDPNMITNWKQ